MDPAMLAAFMARMNLDPHQLLSMQGAVSSASRGLTVRRPPPTFQHDMSPEETTEFLRQYKEWFEEDRRIPPEPAPLFDRSLLVSEQYRRRAELERGLWGHGAGAGVQMLTTFVGLAKHSSVTPIQELRPVRFADMLVRQVHVGKYLLCRIIAPCSRIVAIQTMIEDVDGVAYDLSIYNFPSTSDCALEFIDALFPVGRILAIREPTFKTPMHGDRPLVRVDSPTDISFVGPGNSLLAGVVWRIGATVPRSPTLPATLEAWQQRGNEYFKASQWFLAAFAYSQGLFLQPGAAVLLLNRAEAYLRLTYYSGALCDAQRVLSIEGNPDAHVGKAVFRLAKAHYGRGAYTAAQESFVRWKTTHVGDPAADPWIARCRARQREQSTGVYDWSSLFRTARDKLRLDIANYTGPVEVSTMTCRGGGRGIVATKDLQVGDVLMVTKPFMSVYESDLPKDKMTLTLDLISETLKDGTQAVLLERIIDKIYGNPDLRDEVFHLYAGPDYMSPPSTYPPAFREYIPVEPLDPRIDIDIAQVEAICTYNCFDPYRLETHGSKVNATGLYPLASLFNHSCLANAHWYCIGDVIIIRATEPIPPGTEITISYSSGQEAYEDRQDALKKHMVEHCVCSLCEQDRQDGDARLRRRHELQKKRVLPAVFATASLSQARAIEKDVRKTFGPTRGPIRPLLGIVLHAVAEKLRAAGNQRQLREALQKDVEALRCFGFDLLQGQEGVQASSGLPIGTTRLPVGASSNLVGLGDMMLRVAATYVELEEEANAVLWIKAALWFTNASVGGEKKLFMLVHEKAMKQVGMYEYVSRVLS